MTIIKSLHQKSKIKKKKKQVVDSPQILSKSFQMA